MTSIVLRILIYIAAATLILGVTIATCVKGKVWTTAIFPVLLSVWLFICGLKDMKEMKKLKNAKRYGDNAYGIVLSCSSQPNATEGLDYSIHYLMFYVNALTLTKQAITGLEANRFGKPGEFLQIKIYQGEKYIIDRMDNDSSIPEAVRDRLLDAAQNYL